MSHHEPLSTAYHLGVDLGTTFTAAAVARDRRVEPVTLGSNSTTVPSVVFLADEGLVVGLRAQMRGATDPARVVREFKRRVGDPVPILVGDSPIAAERLMARVLDWVVAEVSTAEGGPPADTVVTHPANWGPYKLELLQRAIGAVGLQVDRLVPEPVAAATSYASRRDLPPGTVVAVYDLGGGTFDAAVLRSTPAGFEIVGQPDGVERLGGIDFDHAVLRHVALAAGLDLDALGPDAQPAVTAAVSRLRHECVAAKEALSVETEVAVPVSLPDRYTEVRLQRAQLEAMIRPALDETVVALRRAIASARLAPADVTAVLLVGGSSRIPLVGQLVATELGRPVAVDARPKDATALGAALVAAARAATPPVLKDAGSGADARSSTTVPAPPPGPPPTRPPPPSPGNQSGTSRRRGRLVPATLVAVAVAFVGIVVVQSGGSGGTGSEPTDGSPAAVETGTDDTDSEQSTPGDPTANTMFVTAGSDHTCALPPGEDATGALVTCWGNDDHGQASAPAEPLDAIDAGAGFTCAIRPDDTFADQDSVRSGPAVCWGNDDHGQATPQQVESFVRYFTISVGGSHGCGLHPEPAEPGHDYTQNEVWVGTVSCWGNDDHGQATPPARDTSRWHGVSAGGEHTCAVSADAPGRVGCWGNDDHGQATPPDAVSPGGDIDLSGAEYTRVSAGWDHTCAIRELDNVVDCWGNDEQGQASPPDEQLVAVSAGNGFTCAIRTDDTVMCWGGADAIRDVPEGEFASVSAGDAHACGVRLDETVACWGVGAAALDLPADL